MARKKESKDKDPGKKKADKDRKKKADEGKKKKNGDQVPAVAPFTPEEPPAEVPADVPAASPSEGATLTQEDALALAEALVEMVNEGAADPVAFFVSGDDALGRELIQLQGGEPEEMQSLVPVVLDAAQVRRIAMLTIADEMIWRQGTKDES